MNKVGKTSAGATLVVAAACSTANLNSAPGGPIQVTRLRSEPYSFSYNSGFDQPARLVVRDPAAWQSAWQQTFGRQRPVPPLPEIDFSREMVVLVALGSRASGGYTILIDGATSTDSGASIAVRSVSPGPKCGTTAALTQPVDIARVPRLTGNVSFVERNEVSQCE